MATDSSASPDPLSAITGLTSLAGIGLKIAGTTGSVGISSQLGQLGYTQGQLGVQQAAIGAQEAAAGAAYSAVQTGQKIGEIGLEQSLEATKRQAMEMGAQRMSLENLRTTQKQAALGRAAAANQGALQTSGYGGGQGETAATGGWNALGISQQLSVGEQAFDINKQISDSRIAQAQSKLSYDTQMAGFTTALTGIQSEKSQIQGEESVLKGQQATYSGITSLGGDLMSAAPSIAKLATTLGPMLLA